ncbi:MAG: Soluble quinoprotein glucose/sorbosone dehydrogenase [Blastococcus sp.]|jgi:glucose/arabinose dehydrogenase|nr:Soluble quinoprotein glucose/sorbosone dehydrogenase [Blastococcus sp.]
MTAAPRVRLVVLLLSLGAVSASCTAGDDAGQGGPSASPSSRAPALDVTVVADGLDHPWDVVQAADGTLLFDERAGGFTAVLPDGTVRPLRADFDDLYAQGETGLMGLELDPDFAGNRRLYSCQGKQADDGGRSIAVVAWTVTADWSAATRVADPLVGGIPVNQQAGRHGGCRLRFAPDGALLIGTGDNALGTNPQNPESLAGKVLRADPDTGEVVVWTIGHRNVQGLAVRPGTGQVFSVEHGPDRDDEVNLLRSGANFGWDPVGSGTYDESVPMTDPDIAGAVPAVWSSGERTLATSGATFVDGEQWGSYDGLLLIGLLKAQGVLALRLDPAGALEEQFRLPELDGSRGRLRSVVRGTDGDVYVTTDNGDGSDRILQVAPRE